MIVVNDRREWLLRRRPCRREQALEAARLIERSQFIGAADVMAVNEDLRHRAPPAALDHLGAPLRVLLDADLLVAGALALEEPLRARAVGAPGGGVHFDQRCRHVLGSAAANRGPRAGARHARRSVRRAA